MATAVFVDGPMDGEVEEIQDGFDGWVTLELPRGEGAAWRCEGHKYRSGDVDRFGRIVFDYVGMIVRREGR